MIKYCENDVKMKILGSYKSLRKFAESVGVDAAQITRWLKAPTDKFKAALLKGNINVSDIEFNLNKPINTAIGDKNIQGDNNIQNSKVHTPQNKADIIRQFEQLDGGNAELIRLRQENAELRDETKRLNAELLKCKDQIISILSFDNCFTFHTTNSI